MKKKVLAQQCNILSAISAQCSGTASAMECRNTRNALSDESFSPVSYYNSGADNVGLSWRGELYI